MVKVACSLVAALLLVSSGAAYSRSQASPTTLVQTTGRIVAFAQDGDQIAWASVNTHAACTYQVWIRLLGPKKQKLVSKPAGLTCYSNAGFGSGLALAGKRALWRVRSEAHGFIHGTYGYEYAVTASYAGARDVELEEFSTRGDLSGISGDSSTLVYGFLDDPFADIMTGGVKRVTGTHEVVIPSTPPPVALAAAGNRVALVVAERAVIFGGARPGSPATVVIKNASSGASIGSFSPAGKPLAIAFAPSVVAVLESTASGRRIEFRTPAGALLRRVAVSAKVKALSTTNKRTVFRVGKSIRTVRVAAGVSNTVATAAATPIGLSIEGTRVTWAENVKIHGVLRGRIRAITIR